MKTKFSPPKAMIAILVIGVLYLVFKSSNSAPQSEDKKIENIREFATFINEHPNLIQSPEAQVVKGSNTSSTSSINDQTNNQKTNEALDIEDRETFYEYTSEWNADGFVRNQKWMDQMEILFQIAERSKAPDALNLIKHQIEQARGENNPDLQSRLNLWWDRYSALEFRSQTE